MIIQVNVDDHEQLCRDLDALAAKDLHGLDVVLGEDLAQLKRVADFALRSVRPALLLEEAEDALRRHLWDEFSWEIVRDAELLVLSEDGCLEVLHAGYPTPLVDLSRIPAEWHGFPVRVGMHSGGRG